MCMTGPAITQVMAGKGGFAVAWLVKLADWIMGDLGVVIH